MHVYQCYIEKCKNNKSKNQTSFKVFVKPITKGDISKKFQFILLLSLDKAFYGISSKCDINRYGFMERKMQNPIRNYIIDASHERA